MLTQLAKEKSKLKRPQSIQSLAQRRNQLKDNNEKSSDNLWKRTEKYQELQNMQIDLNNKKQSMENIQEQFAQARINSLNRTPKLRTRSLNKDLDAESLK